MNARHLKAPNLAVITASPSGVTDRVTASVGSNRSVREGREPQRGERSEALPLWPYRQGDGVTDSLRAVTVTSDPRRMPYPADPRAWRPCAYRDLSASEGSPEFRPSTASEGSNIPAKTETAPFFSKGDPE